MLEASQCLIVEINLSHKTTIIKATWYWQENREVGQWTITEDPEVNPYNNQLMTVFNREG